MPEVASADRVKDDVHASGHQAENLGPRNRRPQVILLIKHERESEKAEDRGTMDVRNVD